MKKTISLILSVVLMLGTFTICCNAADFQIYVTISDGTKAVVANEKIAVKDSDGNGLLTINDALICAHNEFYEGGAKSGYKSSLTLYGLSLDKLWGIANGGSYGYYVNDTTAYSLLTKINDGDHVYAFVYSDIVNFSDAYAFFDVKEIDCHSFTSIELTLNKITFDKDWNPVTSPVKNAVITVDGAKSKFKTDENGKVKINITKSGSYIIGAVVSDGSVITPPVCRLEVEKGNFVDLFSYIIALILAVFQK